MHFILIRRWMAAVLPLVLFFCGCCPTVQEQAGTAYRVVTQVQIVYENGASRAQRQYFREESIRQILDYLRYIDPYGIPREDPEQVRGRNYEIRLIYSDGSEHIYQQRADQYMRIDGGKWKRIDSQKALYLSGLWSMMPNEEAPTDAAPAPPLLMPQL